MLGQFLFRTAPKKIDLFAPKVSPTPLSKVPDKNLRLIKGIMIMTENQIEKQKIPRK